MLELDATNTHLYPGARGTVLSGAPGDGPVTLRFADGAAAPGMLQAETLKVEPYTTAAGTRIAAKAWRIAFDGAQFRITARDNA
ncbi:hypothetical protein [Roseovarius indicus]|jgi:hypothetical protein|uniref:Uncharacterized protein n=1 Tax=Roseovarius indicus TaxID=540747 RepID=A0A0T5P750_9RHOB|nr:hypothetical protein [Roseovarius indicus]KRS17177.1 hypothetical protein XM52_13935 [Roseovarius indicus]QEW27550.1 hypothetical protein RIdsm_03366 [Roseovarius indicus]SFE35971.1 hypothetical protein SAMN04488031_108230 [Roseovarius indicus]